MMSSNEGCRLCKYPAEVDDVALGLASGRYICVRCYTRELEQTLVVPRSLRRAIEEVLLSAGERTRT